MFLKLPVAPHRSTTKQSQNRSLTRWQVSFQGSLQVKRGKKFNETPETARSERTGWDFAG